MDLLRLRGARHPEQTCCRDFLKRKKHKESP
jgi:hypothetical protein